MQGFAGLSILLFISGKYFFKTSKFVGVKNKRSINTILGFSILYQLFYMFLQPTPNLFKEFDLPINAPNSIIRYRLMEKHGFSLSDLKQVDFQSEPNNHTDVYIAAKLLKKLKTNEDKAKYFVFGQSSVLNCRYCKSEYDYIAYEFSKLNYLLPLIVVAIVSSHQEKGGWLFLGLASLMILALYELLILTVGLHADYIIFTIREYKQNYLYTRLEELRSVFILGIYFVLLLFDRSAVDSMSATRSKILQIDTLTKQIVGQLSK